MKLPFVTGQEAAAAAAAFPTPFHLYDEATIRSRARRLLAAFAWNPGFKEYFAVKANPNPSILAILGQEGVGADCSSYTELLLAQRAGFRGHDIMFSSNVTPEADMALAVRLGGRIGLDDISHIDFLERVAGGLPDTLTLRFNPGDSFTIGNSIMSRPGSAKYGLTREQLFEAARRLRAAGVQRIGLHAFLSSNTTEPEYWPALARLLFETAVELANEGIKVDAVNLSGGIGIPYHPDDTEIDIEATGERVRRLFNDIMVPAGLGSTAIHAELGRWLLAPAGLLVARVLHEKHIHKHYLGLDACAANLMRPAMYGSYHHISVVGREHEAPTGSWDVTGGLCENNDKFAIDRPLPPVGIGDILLIHDTGAHGHSMGYNYNGKLRSAEVLRRSDGSLALIRRAENPDDYLATLEGIPLGGTPVSGPT